MTKFRLKRSRKCKRFFASRALKNFLTGIEKNDYLTIKACSHNINKNRKENRNKITVISREHRRQCFYFSSNFTCVSSFIFQRVNNPETTLKR